MARRSASPSPSPSPFTEAVAKGSNSRSDSDGGTPGPLSTTLSVTLPAGERHRVIVTRGTASRDIASNQPEALHLRQVLIARKAYE